jgi:hypothetical protein
MMRNYLGSLFRHPRRLGFAAFNLVIILLLALRSAAEPADPEAGLLDLPNLVVGYVGTTFLLTVWGLGWVAWTLMVLSRRRRLRQAAINGAPGPPFG